VTGFGLVGHASEMGTASRATLEFEAAAIPAIEGVRGIIPGNVPGGARTNAEHFAPQVKGAGGIDPGLVTLLHDPQTSGGLLAAIAPAYLDRAVSALRGAGAGAWVVGRVRERAGCSVLLVP
jgi:selenide,water dikinase